MEYFKGATPGAGILVTFDPGDLLLEGLIEVLRQEGVDFGIIPCGVGSLATANIFFAGNPAGAAPILERASVRGILEIGSLQGPVVNGEPHVHVVLRDAVDGQMYVGHMEPGCEILNRMEVVIQPTEGPKLHRVVDPETGAFFVRARTET